MFVLRGVQWKKDEEVVRTKIVTTSSSSKEIIGGSVYVKTGKKARIKRCWWCRQIANIVVSLPLALDQKEGYFCCDQCAMAYAVDRSSIEKEKYAHSVALLHHRWAENGNTEPLKRAPHWKLLEEHDGCLSVQEWKRDCGMFSYIETCNAHPLKNLQRNSLWFKEE